jgi:hypothetical protein
MSTGKKEDKRKRKENKRRCCAIFTRVSAAPASASYRTSIVIPVQIKGKKEKNKKEKKG